MSPWSLWICIVLLIGSEASADVPFVFEETTSSIANYADQIQKISATSLDLVGVPQTTTPPDSEILKFPITGGGNTPGGTTEKKVADLKETLSSKVEADNPAVVEEAGLAAGKYSGDYTIEQVSAIYNYLKENWHYLRDPRGIDYFKNASESLDLGKKSGCAGVGDCDDFAILMSALVEATGGTTRVILARNNTTGGHAYAEVYLGQLNTTNNQVESIINWLRQNYDADKIYTHIDTDTKDVWLNLDWGIDDNGNAHPGGPFFQGDKHYVVCIRDTLGKTPLKPPEKPNKPPKLISLTSDKLGPQTTGTTSIWTAEAKDPENDRIQYRFFLNNEPETKWQKENTWTWTTTDYDIGDNQIEVRARDGKHAGPDGFDSNRVTNFKLNAPYVGFTQANVDSMNTINVVYGLEIWGWEYAVWVMQNWGHACSEYEAIRLYEATNNVKLLNPPSAEEKTIQIKIDIAKKEYEKRTGHPDELAAANEALARAG
ncbi:MAG: transglutaminase-like domain-containing protein [Methanothrix sp.]|nr:transglutaminase-like domain-containing protein [Methanothrix sp.]